MNLYPVSIIKQKNTNCYPEKAPFSPHVIFDESPIKIKNEESNDVYDSVRNIFISLNYDKNNLGTKNWNPLGWLISPGETVFIKPNMIAQKHTCNNDWDYVITHGAVIRAVIDYIFIALKGEGRIILGDAPSTDSIFEKIVERMGLVEIQELYQKEKKFPIEIVDLRNEFWIQKDGIFTETINLPGDPEGSVQVDLAGESMFTPHDHMGKNYYGAYYDSKETNEHHKKGKHEYCISKSPIKADVFINIPKLKTHKKCGITVNLKSLVGINANKNWLPHYCFGSPGTGGDQFKNMSIKKNFENYIVKSCKKILLTHNPIFQLIARKMTKRAYKVFGNNEEIIRSGNWHGNDTVWRMCVDLNRILMYSDPEGVMRERRQAKKFFSIVDGIICMEGNGPLSGNKREDGILVAGSNPVAVDAVCAKLIGFDYKKINLISCSFETHKYPLIDGDYKDILPTSNVPKWNKPLENWDSTDLLNFKAPLGWAGNIEL